MLCLTILSPAHTIKIHQQQQLYHCFKQQQLNKEMVQTLQGSKFVLVLV